MKIDYDLLQTQKRVVMDCADATREGRFLTEEKRVQLNGLVEMLDSILDDAASRGVWDYQEWQRRYAPDEVAA